MQGGGRRAEDDRIGADLLLHRVRGVQYPVVLVVDRPDAEGDAVDVAAGTDLPGAAGGQGGQRLPGESGGLAGGGQGQVEAQRLRVPHHLPDGPHPRRSALCALRHHPLPHHHAAHRLRQLHPAQHHIRRRHLLPPLQPLRPQTHPPHARPHQAIGSLRQKPSQCQGQLPLEQGEHTH
jgi:hypothetical protein